MTEFLDQLWIQLGNKLQGFVDQLPIAAGLRAAFILLFGALLARWISATVVRLLSRISDRQQRLMIRRLSYWGVFGLAFISALRELGFDLSVLLGAAGILTVAIGFASQTSASNLISGLFLYGERPFVVGDVVRIGGTTGEVLTIDLLSTKLRTFDNLFVRIPNENLMKAEVVNLTRFPIRRVDLQVGVAYKEDLEAVRNVLFQVAEENPFCLQEPQPQLFFGAFADSSVNLQFSAWAERDQYIHLKNSLAFDVKRAFEHAGIEIPFPHRTLYTGSVTDPMPVRMVTGKAQPEEDDEPRGTGDEGREFGEEDGNEGA
jgi:small-conductance mechanosensitive channel